jgi:hypothetical protein
MAVGVTMAVAMLIASVTMLSSMACALMLRARANSARRNAGHSS